MDAPTNPLRAYRAANALTLEQFGLAFHVNKTTVLRWEEGQVPAERVLAISKETGIAPHILRPDIYPQPARSFRALQRDVGSTPKSVGRSK